MPRILGQRLAFAAGVFVLLVGVPNPAQQKRPDLDLRENKIPERAKMELEQADKFELLSLRPVVRGGDFHGYQVLGKTEILDAKTRKSLVSALENGAAENHGDAMLCFNPRHGIHVARHDKEMDFVICFECLQVRIYGDVKGSFLVSRSPQLTFDKALRDAGIPPADR